MKFLCVECDEQMIFQDRDLPGDGTLAAAFRCPACERRVGLLTNPMETQLVSSLGVKIGGREVPEQPLEASRTQLAEARPDAFADVADDTGDAEEAGPAADAQPSEGSDPDGDPNRGEDPLAVRWSDDAVERLNGVPSFVRGMVRRIYTDYARERGIREITPAIMDRARSDLGLEGM